MNKLLTMPLSVAMFVIAVNTTTSTEYRIVHSEKLQKNPNKTSDYFEKKINQDAVLP